MASLIPGAEVSACSADKDTTKTIKDNVPLEEQVQVTNENNELVGVFHKSEDGAIYALYLCGDNSEYFYAEGDLSTPQIQSIYSDEYDVEIKKQALEKGVLSLEIFIKFTGDDEDADYGPITTKLFVKIP